MKINPVIKAITDRIIQRSSESRLNYLKQMQDAHKDGVARATMSCGNLAHA
mgnify:FL=1